MTPPIRHCFLSPFSELEFIRICYPRPRSLHCACSGLFFSAFQSFLSEPPHGSYHKLATALRSSHVAPTELVILCPTFSEIGAALANEPSDRMIITH